MSGILTAVFLIASVIAAIAFGIIIYGQKSGNKINVRLGNMTLNSANNNEKARVFDEVERSQMQEFLEISDIEGNIIKLKKNNGLRIILSISSPDFALLNEDEKGVFENALLDLGLSLNFPIQFFTTSTKVETKASAEKALAITEEIDEAIDQKLKDYAQQLYDRLIELEDSRNVYVRKSYCVIGVDGISDRKRAEAELRNRASTVLGSLQMAKMRVTLLEKEKIAQLFANVLNKGSNISIEHMLENEVLSTYSE